MASSLKEQPELGAAVKLMSSDRVKDEMERCRSRWYAAPAICRLLAALGTRRSTKEEKLPISDKPMLAAKMFPLPSSALAQ